jgi:hypothetical protein
MRLALAALASLLFVSVSAYADTISAGPVSVFTLNPSSDTLTFGASSEDVSGPGTFAQAGTFYIGDSEIPDQTVPFTFTDSVTVNGITQDLVFTGKDAVTTGPDVLTLYGLGPVYFGNTELDFSSLSVTGNGTVGQSLPVDLDATVTEPTPEAPTLALVGMALVGLFVITRPRSRAYSSWRGR